MDSWGGTFYVVVLAFIIQYVTPAFLARILGFWFVQEGWIFLIVSWGAIFGLCAFCFGRAFKKKP